MKLRLDMFENKKKFGNLRENSGNHTEHEMEGTKSYSSKPTVCECDQ
jgi:hypothetical protein